MLDLTLIERWVVSLFCAMGLSGTSITDMAFSPSLFVTISHWVGANYKNEMKNIILASIIGFVLGSTSTLLVLNGLPGQIKLAIPTSSNISSTIRNSTWENEDGSLRVYFTESDVCIFDFEDNPVDSKFSYSVSGDKIFLNPEDVGSTFLSIGSSKLTWTFVHHNGILTTEIGENQLKLKKIN